MGMSIYVSNGLIQRCEFEASYIYSLNMPDRIVMPFSLSLQSLLFWLFPQQMKKVLMASLCKYRHKAEKIISRRISNAKVICIIELELMELMSNRIATRTNSSNSMPSNTLRILLLYGLMERCIRRIAAQVVMRCKIIG